MIHVYGTTSLVKDVSLFINDLSSLSKKYNVVIQAVNADMIYSKRHLLSAAEHAIRAVRQGRNTMSTLAMELLLYTAGERQIKIAIDKIGVKKDSKRIALVVISDLPDISEASGVFTDEIMKEVLNKLHLREDESLLRGDKHTLIRFGLTEEEIETVPEDKYEGLILERVAMVDVIK